MTTYPRVLITSVGRRGQLVKWFKQEVGDEGCVLAVDASSDAPAAYLADNWFRVPRLDSGAYLDTLVGLCEREGCDLLVPTIDTELRLVAEASDRFLAVGTKVLVSDPSTVHLTASKTRSAAWLTARGFPVLRQELVRAGSPWPRTLEFPIFIKPDEGSRSIGARLVPSRMHWLDDAPDTDYVVQEFIQGDEFTVSCYVSRKGTCVAAVPRQRIEVREGEVSKAITRRAPEIEDLAIRIAEALPGAWGPMNIQFIREHQGDKIWVMEINARFGGGDPLAWHAGANAPAWAIAETLGQPLPSSCEWQSDIAMLRFDDAIFISGFGS